MNVYEIIGQTVVLASAIFVTLLVLAFIVRYFAIAWAFIYTHCVKGVGTKEEFKKKRFWRIRLAVMLFCRYQYITAFFGSESISNKFYRIDLDRFIPRVTFYDGE